MIFSLANVILSYKYMAFEYYCTKEKLNHRWVG